MKKQNNGSFESAKIEILKLQNLDIITASEDPFPGEDEELYYWEK